MTFYRVGSTDDFIFESKVFFVYAILLKIAISMLIAMTEMVTFIVSVLLVLRVMVRFAMISMSV